MGGGVVARVSSVEGGSSHVPFLVLTEKSINFIFFLSFSCKEVNISWCKVHLFRSGG